MEILGKVIEILPEVSGEGRNGMWRKQEFILETNDQYPKKVCISIWGEKIDQARLQTGEEITAHINIESREFNGRWYTDVKAWRIEKANTSNQPNPPHNQDPGPGMDDIPYENDLPF
jgi:hypothetical protein